MVKISVVMAVYNNEERVAATVDGILTQTEPDFEMIVVDDGSTDQTPAILDGLARSDARIRIITQPNIGLTRALIRGCAETRAPLIAREDSGDLSFPRRLAEQSRVFDEHDEVVLAGCLTRFVAPDGEELYIADRDGDEVRRSLLHDGVESLVGMPGHSTAMFRRDAYLRAGGYREQFAFGQDLDLWIRLAALGRIVIVRELMHESLVGITSISGRYRPQQMEIAAISIALRRATSDEERDALLARAAAIVPSKRSMTRRERFMAFYFIAAVLRSRGDRRYRNYLWRMFRALFSVLLIAWFMGVV